MVKLNQILNSEAHLHQVKELPFKTVYDDTEHEVFLYKSWLPQCEYRDGQSGRCDDSGHFYGTVDCREPLFCARHFYMNVLKNDNPGVYKLVSKK